MISYIDSIRNCTRSSNDFPWQCRYYLLENSGVQPKSTYKGGLRKIFKSNYLRKFVNLLSFLLLISTVATGYNEPKTCTEPSFTEPIF